MTRRATGRGSGTRHPPGQRWRPAARHAMTRCCAGRTACPTAATSPTLPRPPLGPPPPTCPPAWTRTRVPGRLPPAALAGHPTPRSWVTGRGRWSARLGWGRAAGLVRVPAAAGSPRSSAWGPSTLTAARAASPRWQPWWRWWWAAARHAGRTRQTPAPAPVVLATGMPNDGARERVAGRAAAAAAGSGASGLPGAAPPSGHPNLACMLRCRVSMLSPEQCGHRLPAAGAGAGADGTAMASPAYDAERRAPADAARPAGRDAADGVRPTPATACAAAYTRGAAGGVTAAGGAAG